MISLEPGRTTLRSVLVRGGSRDPLALKLHLERLLNATDLHCARLPASACLIVRHLSDPLPGKLRLGSGTWRAPAPWERALQEALESQARHASRPARGPVSADANAVLFADRAELLACLAADRLAGLLSAHWWWRCLFPHADLPGAALAAWQTSPEELPPAFEQLARRGQAAAFARTLEARITRQMLLGLSNSFGLPRLVQILGLVPEAGTADIPVPAAVTRSAPWQALVPESGTEGLAIEQQTLLGVALTLRRAPAFARSPAFSSAVHLWRQAASLPQQVEALEIPGQPPTNKDSRETATEIETTPDVKSEIILPGRSVSPPQAGAGNAPTNFSQATTSATGATDDHRFAPTVDFKPGRMSINKTEARPGTSSQQRIEFIAGTKPERTFVSKSRASLETAPVQPVRPRVAEVRDDQGVTVEAETVPDSQALIEPQGLPILEPANLAEASPATEILAAPACEETALVETIFTRFGGVFYLLNLALALGLYGDFSMPLQPGLELSPWDFLALVGRALIGPSLEEDPLWLLLRRLAGRRPDQAPGQGFEPPGGLSLDRWLEETVAQIRSQLFPALGLEQDDLFFAHSARIEQSSSRLDIFFSLVEHPIQIRLAGLDRDPGWIPAAGRSVVYHYD